MVRDGHGDVLIVYRATMVHRHRHSVHVESVEPVYRGVVLDLGLYGGHVVRRHEIADLGAVARALAQRRVQGIHLPVRSTEVDHAERDQGKKRHDERKLDDHRSCPPPAGRAWRDVWRHVPPPPARSHRYVTERVSVKGERPRNLPSTGSGTGCEVTVTVTYSVAVAFGTSETLTVFGSRLLYPNTDAIWTTFARTGAVIVARSSSLATEANRAPSRSPALMALSCE